MAAVKIGDQGEGSGDVKGLADAHEGASGEKLFIGVHVAGGPGDGRPDEEAAGNDMAAAETIGDVAANRG